jgi:hypothetical protein
MYGYKLRVTRHWPKVSHRTNYVPCLTTPSAQQRSHGTLPGQFKSANAAAVADGWKRRIVESSGTASSISSICAKRRIDSESYSESSIPGSDRLEPLLHEINAKHPLHRRRLRTVAGPGVMRLIQRQHRSPRDHLVHLRQNRLCRVTLLPVVRRRCKGRLLHPAAPLENMEHHA